MSTCFAMGCLENVIESIDSCIKSILECLFGKQKEEDDMYENTTQNPINTVKFENVYPCKESF